LSERTTVRFAMRMGHRIRPGTGSIAPLD
jgi:hypothetical protein